MTATNLAKSPSEQGTGALYEAKPVAYFEGSNNRIVELLPNDASSRILEIGCGAGATGALAFAERKASEYVGLELNQAAANIAANRLSRVIVGDVETMDLAPVGRDFDVLIASEVLEHLIDPWSALRRLVQHLKMGGLVICSSPNISNRHTVVNLIKNRFDYSDQGVMDRSHLRWFTPRTYAQLIESAGVDVLAVGPLTPLRRKARVINALTGRRLQHLLHNQTLVLGRRIR